MCAFHRINVSSFASRYYLKILTLCQYRRVQKIHSTTFLNCQKQYDHDEHDQRRIIIYVDSRWFSGFLHIKIIIYYIKWGLRFQSSKVTYYFSLKYCFHMLVFTFTQCFIYFYSGEEATNEGPPQPIANHQSGSSSNSSLSTR